MRAVEAERRWGALGELLVELSKRMNSSMQLTRAADYGVRVMVTLAESEQGRRVSLPELTKATAAPESFLSKVLQSLAHARLVNSRRGLGGGFEISQLGREASIRAVVEAVDGPIVLNVCLANESLCKRSAWCPAHPVWAKAQQAMLEVLEGSRVSELADQGAANEFVLVAKSCIAPATTSPSAD